MPKIIEGLKEKILVSARTRLLSGNASELSLRGVARDCGIAVGTVYNYYKDKESLMAAVMAEDWIGSLKEMRGHLQEAESFEEGLLGILGGIRDFASLYEGVWQSSPTAPNFGASFAARHGMLLGQIREEISLLAGRFGKDLPESSLTLLAELVIASSRHPEIPAEELLRIISV